MAEQLGNWKRSEYCAEPTKEKVSQELTLMGWAAKRRDLGGLIFVDLRDRSGIMQVVLDESKISKEIFSKAETIRTEFVLAVKGVLQLRDEETINKNIPTGEIELHVTELKVLSESETPPFMIEDDNETQELVRLKSRYLDLRRPEMQKIMKLRNDVTMFTREFFANKGFIDIETPILCKSTPEGARDYLVPSRVHQGKFYALPQSPQIFKQLLMLSGFDKYIQIAKCFRDEDLRADRQPEFTQIDLEMSFVDQEEIMQLGEDFTVDLFKKVLGVNFPTPIPRIKYKDAMDRFGSDKPDTRFGLELVDISDIAENIDFKVFSSAIKAGGSVRCINAKDTVDKLARREIDKLVDFTKLYGSKGLAWISVTADGLKSAITKFMTEEQVQSILERCDAQPNDTLFFVADADSDVVYNSLGALRLELAKKFDLIDETVWDLLWVYDFPEFEYDKETKRYYAVHHPFTCPKDEDLDKLESDPSSVIAKAYDLVLNGNELGGGSIRIHRPDLQKRVFEVLGFTEEQIQEQFGFMVNAYNFGAPPHGGIAIGMDRLVMLMAGTSNIRDVMAFPKIQSASDPMSECPSEVSEDQLEELGLRIDIAE